MRSLCQGVGEAGRVPWLVQPRQHEGVQPMLAVPAERVGGLPEDGGAWAYEVKWDGMRVLADVRDGRVRLTSRRGNEVTVAFPELARLASAHPDVLVDGEVVVLRLYGVDLTGRPWQERREALERLAPSGTAWQLSPVYDDGPALLDATRERGLEGVVAKRRASPYREGARTGDWVKLAHQRVDSCVVGGWRGETEDAGRVGAFLLGLWSQGPGRRVLRYAGKAGSGLATADQSRLLALLGQVARKGSPFDPPVPRPDSVGAHWLEPSLVVDVRHLGHTDGGRLRQPVVLGVRPDLDADDLAEA